MLVIELINKANLLATGEITTIAPNTSTYRKLLAIANIMQRDWQNEAFPHPDKRWNSLKHKLTLDIEKHDTEYNLGEDFLGVARKSHLVIDSKNVDTTYAISGNTVTFKEDFVEKYHGKELTMEIYQALDELKEANQQVKVDDPNWLAYMVAAEAVRTDVVTGHQFGNLVAYAQNLMAGMKRRDAQGSLPTRLKVRGV